MKIEITTTKKKLSKAIVNQMPFLVFKDFESFEIIRLLRNVRRKMPKVLLCKHVESGYFLLSTELWIFDDDRHLDEVWVNGSAIISFDNNSDRNIWWIKYQKALAETTQVYI